VIGRLQRWWTDRKLRTKAGLVAIIPILAVAGSADAAPDLHPEAAP